MKIDLNIRDEKALEPILIPIFEKIFEEKKNDLNNGDIVDVLQEISATGSRLFLKIGLEILSKETFEGMPSNLEELLKQL